MSVICSGANKAAGNNLYIKGAAEKIIERCSFLRLATGATVALTPKAKADLIEKAEEMAVRPLRVLGLAVKEAASLGPLNSYNGEQSHSAHKLLLDPEKFAAIESNMVLVGLVGIKDPARPEVKPAIKNCKLAGVRVIMITGDNKATAEAIAHEIGIFEPGEDISRKSFTGHEFFNDYNEQEQKDLLMEDGGGRVFSRTEPRDKQQLVKLLRGEGEVPAMTGDGVNDAPALKQAAIGVAMGIAGTEVAKEASDMILADDNFATIVSAIEEGRSIYSNMKAFIRYLISSNIGEVASIFLTASLGLPEGLIPVQLLWVNLVTDGPPATALGFNPPDADIMKKPPRNKDDSLISGWVFFRYMVIGLYVGFATVGVFVYWFVWYDHAGDGHPLVTYGELSNWGKCNTTTWENIGTGPAWTTYEGGKYAGAKACEYFTKGKLPASTLSLSVLVTIEMFNALNALSEDGSLLQMPPWCNPWLLLAMAVSFVLHFVILYVPFLASIFSIVPHTYEDWKLVFYFSFPVILIDEVLKFVGRCLNARELAQRINEMEQLHEGTHAHISLHKKTK